MTAPAPDIAPSCQVGVPGVLRLPPGRSRGAGWYLVAANQRVEAGPFPTEYAAELGADWLWQRSEGINPAPWWALYSSKGLLIGSRVKARFRDGSPERLTG